LKRKTEKYLELRNLFEVCGGVIFL
jgi:hypothetical protein